MTVQTTTTGVSPIDRARIAALTEREMAKLADRTPASRQRYERAVKVMPKGVPSSFQENDPWPIYVERGEGCRVWDVDGHEYTDFHNGFGVMCIGHANPTVAAAVKERVDLGTHFAAPTDGSIVVAEELTRRFGLPQWRFTNSGTESTMDAVHLARGLLQGGVRHHGGGPRLVRRHGARGRDLHVHVAHRHARRCPVPLRPEPPRASRPASIDRCRWSGASRRGRARRAPQGGRRVHRVADLERPSRRSTTGSGRWTSCCCRPGPTSGSDSPEYFAQPGLGREGVLWLVEQGVKVIGIDAYTLDRPFASMVADYQRTGDGRYIWPAHFAGIEARVLPDREAGQPRGHPAPARLQCLVPADQGEAGERGVRSGRGVRGLTQQLAAMCLGDRGDALHVGRLVGRRGRVRLPAGSLISRTRSSKPPGVQMNSIRQPFVADRVAVGMSRGPKT